MSEVERLIRQYAAQGYGKTKTAQLIGISWSTFCTFAKDMPEVKWAKQRRGNTAHIARAARAAKKATNGSLQARIAET